MRKSAANVFWEGLEGRLGQLRMDMLHSSGGHRCSCLKKVQGIVVTKAHPYFVLSKRPFSQPPPRGFVDLSLKLRDG